MNTYQGEETRKITVNLPVSLIERVMHDNDSGLTETIREALQRLANYRACQEILALRGKVKLQMSYEQMKELRD